jgi:hypothetical protein
MMSPEKSITERVLGLLKPFASNWSGTLSRGDLVIPQNEIPRLVHQILSSVQDVSSPHGEASERDVFETLMAARGAMSVQDQVAILRKRFVIIAK